MTRALLLLALGMVAAAPAQALFVKSEMDRIDPEPLFDSEYFADLLGFSYPRSWEKSWRLASSSGAYRVNGASLDCCELLFSQELRFERALLGGLSFRYRLDQHDDKDRQETHHWLELEKSLGLGFGAALFGEPVFNKEDSDIGLSLSWRSGAWNVTARRTFSDFDFNRRTHGTQSYDRKPRTEEVSVAYDGAENRLWAAAEYDWPVIRRVPDEKRVFSYRRSRVRAGWQGRAFGETLGRMEYFYEFKRKANAFSAGQPSLDFRRQVHQLDASLSWAVGARDRLDLGHRLMARSARDDGPTPAQGVFYRRWESQPYARWERRLKEWLAADLSPALALGENRKTTPTNPASAAYANVIEARLGAGLDFIFSGAGSIGLQTTWDLDELAAHPWDGGGVRAMFFF